MVGREGGGRGQSRSKRGRCNRRDGDGNCGSSSSKDIGKRSGSKKTGSIDVSNRGSRKRRASVSGVVGKSESSSCSRGSLVQQSRCCSLG
jgi:hypothetical protein